MPVAQPLASAVFVTLGGLISLATYALARAHLVRVLEISSGQTSVLTRKLSRLPLAARLEELRLLARPETIEWRIAEEALQAEEAFRASAVDSVLADVALELDSRATWPRAAVRIAGASGVLLMAISISLHLDVMISVILLSVGIGSAIVCSMLERRALSISTDIRAKIDALVDVLELRSRAEPRASSGMGRVERRSRRR